MKGLLSVVVVNVALLPNLLSPITPFSPGGLAIIFAVVVALKLGWIVFMNESLLLKLFGCSILIVDWFCWYCLYILFLRRKKKETF